MKEGLNYTISLRAAIDALHTYFKDGFDEDKWWNSTHVLAAIKGLPPARPEPNWIPCNERLPDVDEEVLVTNYAGGIYNIEIDSCGKYLDNDERFWYTAQNPIAWMPLPKPWKGDAE